MSTKSEREAKKRRERMLAQQAQTAGDVESAVKRALAPDSGTLEKPPTPKKVRTTLYISEALYNQAQAAALHFKQQKAKSEPRSVSQLLDDALERELARLSKKHNQGEPF